jgi:AraC-like DNA-binding protein
MNSISVLGQEKIFYDLSDGLKENYRSKKSEYGNKNIENLKRTEFGNGFSLFFSNYKFDKDTFFEVAEPSKFAEFCFCLSGETRCSVKELKDDIVMKKGKCNISFFPDPNGIMKFKGGISCMILAIRIDIAKLSLLFKQTCNCSSSELCSLLSGKEKFIFIENNFTASMMMVIHQIINCSFSGSFRKLYLESKVMELLVHQLDLHNQESLNKPANEILKKYDLDRIYNARDILIEKMQNPPSLVELAREAGINDYKLKIGFRQIFGTTVFGYLHDYRMEYARLLLEDSRKNVAEVSTFVGYTNPSHFASAFRKKFGVNPGFFLSQTQKNKILKNLNHSFRNFQ